MDVKPRHGARIVFSSTSRGGGGAQESVEQGDVCPPISRPPISLSEQQADFEARRMMPGNKLVTPPKPATPDKKKKPAAKQVGDPAEGDKA